MSSSGIRVLLAVCRSNAHGFGYLKAKSLDRGHFRGMIRKQPDATYAQIVQDLGADAVVMGLTVSSLLFCGLKINTLFPHQGVSAQLIYQVEVVLTLPQIQDHAAIGFGYSLERGVHDARGLADRRAEHRKSDVLGLDANQNRLGCPRNVAHNKSEMR